MSTYQQKIDALIGQYDTAADKADRDYRGFAFIGMVWSFTSAFIGLRQGLDDLYNPDSFVQGRYSDKERAERTDRMERRKDEVGYGIAWANSLASNNPEFAISAAEMVERMTQDQATTPTDEASLELMAECAGMEIADLRELDAMNQAQMAERAAIKQAYIQSDKEQIIAEIEAWLKLEVSANWELDDVDALRVARKIGQKAGDHAGKEFTRALQTKNFPRKLEHLGNVRILKDLSTSADQISFEIEASLEAQGPKMDDVTTDHNAAQTDVAQAMEA